MSKAEGIVRRIMAGHHYGAGRGRQLTGQDSKNGALARAVGSQQADDLALGDGERYVPDREARAIPLDQVLRENDRRTHRGAFEYLAPAPSARSSLRSAITFVVPLQRPCHCSTFPLKRAQGTLRRRTPDFKVLSVHRIYHPVNRARLYHLVA